MSFDAQGSRCFLESFGMLAIGDDSFNSTCGLYPNSSGLLQPSENSVDVPLLGDEVCSTLIPSGVDSNTWVECINGSPILHVEVEFGAKTPNHTYACEIHPLCMTGSYKSWLLCYEGGNSCKEEVNGGNFESSTVVVKENEECGPFLSLLLMTLLALCSIFVIWSW